MRSMRLLRDFILVTEVKEFTIRVVVTPSPRGETYRSHFAIWLGKELRFMASGPDGLFFESDVATAALAAAQRWINRNQAVATR